MDFFSDMEFRFLKKVLDHEMKELRAQGIGTKKKQVEPISASEEELLWEKGVLGDTDPCTNLVGYYGVHVWIVLCLVQWRGA